MDVYQNEQDLIEMTEDIPDPRLYIRDLEIFRSNHEDGKALYFGHVDELREQIRRATSLEVLYAISDEANHLDEWAELWIDHWKADPTTFERLQEDIEKREDEIRANVDYRAHLIQVGIIRVAKKEANVR